ncbi:polysaccharide biosynthesis/export family protein [Marivirga salinae]|uniref:Polysaccharide biosynthesis/export family protein n=1 Tax=Marivirga salinarum TaxID=3059078 RepID=A0AA49J953_9BACT|nr:polysaccharide biosynthesis/export family protein [Marivirga sp. BDSF4-3]WKK74537.2 polysaccharide biosynthesis/export family protein [Marivirga sp. BDSF4-3]
MLIRNITLFILVAILFASCVGNKRLVYLQKDDLHENQPKDTVLREYDLTYHDYKIQPQDILSVQFTSITDEDFDIFSDFGMGGGNAGGGGGGMLALRGELVDPQGQIGFPVVGKIKVQGMTIFEVQDTLQSIAARYVEDPVVKVRLLNYRFTILGEVNGESVITTQNTRVTFMEAIGMAGGLTELASRDNVKVVRQKGDTAEVFYIDLLEEEFLESEKFYVYQNDIIIVPPLQQRPIRRYYSQNLSLLLSSVSAVLFIGSFFGLSATR